MEVGRGVKAKVLRERSRSLVRFKGLVRELSAWCHDVCSFIIVGGEQLNVDLGIVVVIEEDAPAEENGEGCKSVAVAAFMAEPVFMRHFGDSLADTWSRSGLCDRLERSIGVLVERFDLSCGNRSTIILALDQKRQSPVDDIDVRLLEVVWDESWARPDSVVADLVLPVVEEFFDRVLARIELCKVD